MEGDCLGSFEGEVPGSRSIVVLQRLLPFVLRGKLGPHSFLLPCCGGAWVCGHKSVFGYADEPAQGWLAGAFHRW